MAISRVIEVSFRGSSVALVRIDTAYFYNNGIIFKPTDIDLPASYQVHWADSPQASSTLETIGTAEGAPIPDDLWNRSRVIYGWIYLHPTNDSGVTGYEVRIYKNVRAGLPDGTEPTPAEQSTIDQLIGALNSAVEQTGEDVESAEQAKDDAESARDNAQTYANNAQSSAQASARSAESASQSASQASTSATASAQSASASAQIKADVEELERDAQRYANSASQSASQASASEQGCARAVLDAASAAAIARARADEASGYAQTASSKASEASQSASQASGYAQTAETAKTDAQTAKTQAETARDEAVTAKTAAETAQGKAEDAQAAAESVAESIPSDYSQLSEDVSDLKEGLSTIANSYTDISMWSQGAITITTGKDAPSSSRIRSSAIPKNIFAINIASGYLAIICCYLDDTYVGWWNGSTFSKADSGTTLFQSDVSLAQLSAYTVRLYVMSETGTNLSPTNDYQCVEFIKYTDDTLTKPNVPADAKKTGDAINAVKDTVISVQSPFVKLTKSSDIFTVEEGYYATTGNKVALAGYVLCSYTAEQDFQIYADAETIAGNPALFVSIYNNSIASGNNVVCYKRSDGTLPTEANKATVYAGQILAISIYSPSSSPADFGIYANYYTVTTLADGVLLNDSQIAQVANKFTNFAYSKKIAWFGDSVSELRNLPHTAGSLMSATVYDCSIRGSVIGRTYSNYNTFSFCNLVTAIIDEDFTAQFAQLDAYEQSQGHTYPGIRENLTTLSGLDFDDIDYVVLLQGTNDFGIPINVQEGSGYANRVDEMQTLMDDAISRFITAYPKLKFYILSPFFRGDKSVDNYNNTLADYVEAEKTVAEKYAIPFYDLLTHSRICEQNKLTYLNSANDLVHPNAYGDDWLAELCAKFIGTN